MRAKLLFNFVICQTIITVSLGGVTLPCSDLIGKVTPIKPKPLSPSTISSLSSSSSLLCECRNRLHSPAPGPREFSSPLAFTSTSKALPVPKIDSASLADVKLPEKLRGKFVLPKLCCGSTRKPKDVISDKSTPDVTLPYKHQYLSIPFNPTQSLPSHSSWDMYSSTLNKMSSLPNIKSLPTVPVSSLKSNADFLTKTAPIRPRYTTLDSPLTLEARSPSFSGQFPYVFLSDSSPSLPYPLYYKSTYLPGVMTPSEMSPITFRPISHKRAEHFKFPRESSSPNLLHCDTNLNSFNPCRNKPNSSPYLNPFPPKSIEPIQLPKTSSNVPLSTNSVFSAQNTAVNNLRSSLEANAGLPSVSFESGYKRADPLISSDDLRDQRDPKFLLSSLPNTLADTVQCFNLNPCSTIKIKPPVFGSPSNYNYSPAPSLIPTSPSSPVLDLLSNKRNNFDCSQNIDKLNVIPIVGACVETIGRLDTSIDNCRNSQCGDSGSVPWLKQINLSGLFAPKLTSYQHPLFTRKCVRQPVCAPKIPCESIPTISAGSSTSYPFTGCSSRVPQAASPISSSIAQTTSKIVSSINDVVSNLAKNIISSYQSYLNPALQNIPQIPTYTTMQSSPCDFPEFLLKQTLPVSPSTVTIKPISPIIISSNLDPPTIDVPTISSFDASFQPEYEMASTQSLSITMPQHAVSTLPPTPPITHSSPPLCPSYLPTPALPSSPLMETPVYKVSSSKNCPSYLPTPTLPSSPFMEAPVYKVSSSKTDDDMEKLIEMMLLTDLLNNDDNSEWDDLDTFLALLSIS